jgi:hypothetical protein
MWSVKWRAALPSRVKMQVPLPYSRAAITSIASSSVDTLFTSLAVVSLLVTAAGWSYRKFR